MSDLFQIAWATYNTQFVSFGLTMLAAFIFWLVQGKAKVRWGVQHGFAHKVKNQSAGAAPAPATLVHSAAILFTNSGRVPAKKVEVTINFEPDSLAIWPQRQYSREKNPDGRLVLGFESLAPQEQLTVNLLTIGANGPDVLSVRAENSNPKEIAIGPARIFSKPMNAVFAVWLLLGLLAAIYITINLIAWFARIGS
ncbi:hypothetical protein [Aminobacter carboxidus]|uniref:Uncharacterized protein n=1 Tax=Aminobacter carboxidus TaxID=376165 RepID=A0ABR9GHY2_9HYPH|nr:hypothetical protein [Aminobacter carboxidus]MBE1203270.1 hypothetical protein [Aminobacter carboxidus]